MLGASRPYNDAMEKIIAALAAFTVTLALTAAPAVGRDALNAQGVQSSDAGLAS